MKNWEKKEKSDQSFFNARKTTGSGNRWYAPGDAKSGKFLIESKQTDKKSYTLSREKLDKIEAEALFSYRIPVMSIKIQDKEVIVMMKTDWEKLIKKD